MIRKYTLAGLMLACSVTSVYAVEHNNTIAVRAGSYNVSTTNQTVLGTNITMTEGSNSVISAEYMFNSKSYRFGMELISFSNAYSDLGLNGKIDSLFIMFNADKFWTATTWLKPYIGVGVGAVAIDVTGPIVGNAGGIAFGARAGLDMQLSSNVELLLEYKMLSGSPDDANGEKIDVSGSGAFAGLKINF